MSIKANSPPIDPETKARQEAAEKRAEAGRIDATQDALSQDTRAIIRNFGRFIETTGRGSFASVASVLPPAALRASASLAASRGETRIR